MARTITFTFLFWSLLLPVSIAQSVPNDSLTVYSSQKARKYKIVLGSKRVIVAHSLDSLKGNQLYISRNKKPYKVSLEVMKALLVAKKNRPVARGLWIGAVTGMSLGALVGLLSYQEPEPNGYFTIDLDPGASAGGGAVLGALVGTLSGTFIGATSNRFTHYDFSTVPLTERAALMSRILQGK